jgi:hypothetical protein
VKREREKREMFNVCVWHQNVHWVARRQTPNDKKKKTDARREKERFFYSHTKMKQKRERERKEKIGRKDAKGTGMGSLRNRELPPTTTACCQSD